jgi:hypothetical protein
MYSLIIKGSISLVPPDLLALINAHTLAAHNPFRVLRENQKRILHHSLIILTGRNKTIIIKIGNQK